MSRQAAVHTCRVVAATSDQVRGVVLEDPPFFSTDPDRMDQQFNYVDLARPAHEYLQQDAVNDFALWYIEHNGWIGYFGGGRDGILEGEMTDDDAELARDLMPDCDLGRVDTGHGFHFEKPAEFAELIRRIGDRVARQESIGTRVGR